MKIFLVPLIAAATGCTAPPPDPLEDLPPLEGLHTAEQKLPTPPGESPETVCAAHILVAYRGARDAYRKIELNRAQARIRAEHLLKLARSTEHDFAELARRYSDDSRTSRQGGDLGIFGRGFAHPALEEAAFSLELGQVSDVVETPTGFHIVTRTEPTEAQAAEIVISYEGAKRYTPRQRRSREEAGRLANSIHERLGRGESFEKLAIEHSDLPNHHRGGIHRIFRKGTRHPEFEKIVWNLAIGEVSDVVETPTGFHIVKRLPVERIQIRTITIAFAGKKDEEGRGNLLQRREALELAMQIEDELKNRDSVFPALASRHSTGVGKDRAGLIDEFGRGRHPYEVEKRAFSLRVGEMSDMFEFEGRFFFIKRIR